MGGYSRQMVSGQTNLYGSNTINPVLAAKASAEVEWLTCIDAYSNSKFALIPWSAGEIKGDRLLMLQEH